MSGERPGFGQRQQVAFAGLFTVVALVACTWLGVLAAQGLGLPPVVGWLAGLVAGWFVSRQVLRRVFTSQERL